MKIMNIKNLHILNDMLICSICKKGTFDGHGKCSSPECPSNKPLNS